MDSEQQIHTEKSQHTSEPSIFSLHTGRAEQNGLTQLGSMFAREVIERLDRQGLWGHSGLASSEGLLAELVLISQ